MQLTIDELKAFNAGAVEKYEQAIIKAKQDGRVTPSGRDILDYWNARMFSIIATKNILLKPKNKKMATKYTAYFDVKQIDSGYIIENDFDTVGSEESAEQECRETVDRYNNSVRPGESKREFIKLNRVDSTFVPDPPKFDDEDFDDDVLSEDEWPLEEIDDDFDDGGFEEDFEAY